MKPLDGNFVENALKHSVTGLNIDGCRVGIGEGGEKPEYKPNLSNAVYGSGMGGGEWKNTNGRFPANVILGHSEGCKCIGTKQVKPSNGSGKASRGKSGGKTFGGDVVKPLLDDMTYVDADGKESVEAWECIEGCAVRRLGEQSGELKSGNLRGEKVKADNRIYNTAGSTISRRLMIRDGDSGTAARFFKQVSEYKEE
jgi:hypothetical protein